MVLDGHTLNPGDLDWKALEALGELEVYARTPAEEVISRGKDADVLLTNKTLIPAGAIAALDRLKYIGVLATGYNVVDTEAAAKRGIPVCNAAGYSTDSVAQMVMAYLLHFSNRVSDHSASARSGKWAASRDFCYWEHDQEELVGKVFGIIGMGTIGTRVATLAQAFGMDVIATTRRPERTPPAGVSWVDREELLRRSDVVSLHCPLTPETEHLINRETLSLMQSSALLINTGRGPLVDEAALAEALAGGRLRGAAVDVLAQEPPREGSPLLEAPNCLVTPHIAWATRASRQRLMRITVENLRAFLAGKVQGRVN